MDDVAGILLMLVILVAIRIGQSAYHRREDRKIDADMFKAAHEGRLKTALVEHAAKARLVKLFEAGNKHKEAYLAKAYGNTRCSCGYEQSCENCDPDSLFNAVRVTVDEILKNEKQIEHQVRTVLGIF